MSPLFIERDTYLLRDEIQTIQAEGILPSLQGAAVVDFCSGVVYGSMLLRELGSQVTAIDIDRERVLAGLAAGNYRGVDVIVKDARAYRSREFDHAFGFHIGSLMVPEGGFPPEWRAILSNICAQVKKGGTIFVSYHCGEDTGVPECLASLGIEGQVNGRREKSMLSDVYFIGKKVERRATL